MRLLPVLTSSAGTPADSAVPREVRSGRVRPVNHREELKSRSQQTFSSKSASLQFNPFSLLGDLEESTA